MKPNSGLAGYLNRRKARRVVRLVMRQGSELLKDPRVANRAAFVVALDRWWSFGSDLHIIPGANLACDSENWDQQVFDDLVVAAHASVDSYRIGPRSDAPQGTLSISDIKGTAFGDGAGADLVDAMAGVLGRVHAALQTGDCVWASYDECDTHYVQFYWLLDALRLDD